ncbi:MAG TPA: carbohydrate porin, partial [Candidatus Omnitrophota bacterium]|nr:carbohydrate porin [Candidatus Omnitrophota bacterium]
LALLHMEPGQGVGAEDQLSLYSNVNRDSNDTDANVPITEIWYEHYLFNRQITMTAGKMDPANYLDQNQYAFNECTQFIARIFRNSPAIEWPDDNTLGGQIILAPDIMPYIALNATYFNANNSYEDVFSKPFISTEVTVKPAQIFGWDDSKWDGNYRFYFWYNGLDHTKLVGQGEPAPDYPKEQNVGYGLSFDQMLTDAFGVFVRAGWQRQDITFVSTNPNAAPIEGQWSCGCQVCGKLWHRDDDILGIAIGQAVPGKAYKDAGNGGAPEGHFEAYYRFKVTSNLYISPDLQYIWNPRGITEDYQGHDGTICVYGVRGQLDF